MIRSLVAISALVLSAASAFAQAPTIPAAVPLDQSSRPAPELTAVASAVIARADGDKALQSFYASRGTAVWTTPDGLTAAGHSARAALARAPDFGLTLDVSTSAARTATTFDAQAIEELNLSRAVLAYALQARGARIPDPSKISQSMDMNPALPEPVSVLEAVASAADAGSALENFHPQHAAFKNLTKALVAARLSGAPADTIQRILVNLERWRWMPQALGAFHVWNNVPEQLTRVVKDDQVVFSERIVVGKPGHSTPIMTADMLYVIFHPSWGVPNGIKTNEVGPMLKRASARNATLLETIGLGDGSGRAASALARHQLRVSQNGREINPDSVDWRTVDIRQFHFTQPPSGKNVLGVVKFRFPNKFDVYMHDTQDRHLFAHNVRAYSHGCMRVQNPVKFASVLLGHDKGWSEQKVQSFVPGGRTADITLTTPIPVHLTYFTASADETGKLALFGDIYGMDSRVASALAGKPVALASAKVTTDSPQRPSRAGAASTRTTEVARPWNPFALSSN